ncbi:MAG: DUF1009 domain-containing protein, partial [Rhizobiaceae bacterium]
MSNNLAIIAGRGSLPLELAMGMRSSGQEPLLIAIEGETESWLEKFNYKVLGWGQFGQLFNLLEEYQADRVVLAGSVTRPRLNFTKMDWVAIRSLPEILAFMIGGDNS